LTPSRVVSPRAGIDPVMRFSICHLAVSPGMVKKACVTYQKIYALAMERITGRAPDRAWLHFLRPNTAIEVDLTPSLLDSPEQVVRDFQEAQDQLEFPLREGDHCHRCPFFRDLCPATGKAY
jgi:hypothetical protein